MSLDPREPTHFSAEVTTTIESRVEDEDEDAASAFIPVPRSTFFNLNTDADDLTPA